MSEYFNLRWAASFCPSTFLPSPYNSECAHHPTVQYHALFNASHNDCDTRGLPSGANFCSI